jgi:hypothetical protein
MVHIPFDTRNVNYDDYILQIGGGGGLLAVDDDGKLREPYTYFRGLDYQRGYGRQIGGGVGDVLRSIWRYLLPVVRTAGTTLGREALSTGERIIDKIAEGENVKEAVITEGKKSLDTLLHKTHKQMGGGIKRRRKRSSTPVHQTIVGRLVNKIPSNKKSTIKRKRIDTFGLY